MATLQEYFDQLPQEIKDAIDTTGLNLSQSINDSEYSKTTLESIINYCAQADDDYGRGTYEDISTLISKKTAEQRTDTEFFDPKDGSTIPAPNGKTKLITGIVSCVENKKFNGATLQSLLADKNLAQYDTVIIPLGVKSGENGDKDNHAISLIVNPKTQKMLFVDQAGEKGSKYYVDKLKELAPTGYDVEVYSAEIMKNRHDCAIFSAYINDLALNVNNLKQEIDDFANKDNKDKNNAIDKFNKDQKEALQKDLFEEYKNNPLFKLYVQSQNKNINNISSKDMLELIIKFSDLNSMKVDGNVNQDQAHMDPLEAEEIRKAIEHANQVLKNDFKEAEEDPNYPGHLVFKDSAKPENRIIFASKSQAFVEGDQKSFDELIVAAKKLNRTKVNFGNFENKPQDKAKLYLACLKYDMEIGSNKPTDQELKNYPEWHQIQFIRATKDISKTFAKRKELEEKSQDKTDSDANERSALVKALMQAKKELENDPKDSAKQKAVDDAKQALENNLLEKELRAAQKAHEESIEQVKDLAQNSPAKDKIKDLPQYAIVEFLTEAENANTAFEELRTLSNDTNKNNEWKNLIERLKTAKDKAKQEPDWTSFEQALKDNNTAEIQRLSKISKFKEYLEAKTNLADDPVQKAQNKYKDSIKKLISLAEKPETKEQIESLPQYRIVKLYNHSKHINELNTKYIKEYNKEKAATPNWEAELAQYHDALNDPNKQANKTTIQNFETAHQDFANAEKALAEEIKENANKYLDPKATEPKNRINYQQTQGGPTIPETDEQFNARKTIFNAKRALAQRLTNTH